MTKAGIVKHLHTEHPDVTRSKASKVVECILKSLKGTLGSGERVLITNFGCFEVLDRQERRGRNPSTGEIIKIKPKRTVVFRCANKLEDCLNGDHKTYRSIQGDRSTAAAEE